MTWTVRRRRGLADGGSGPREPTDFSRWIEKHGIPVRELAARIGVTHRSVYLWASGQRIPDLVAAARIQEITEGAVEWTSFLNTKLARSIYADLVKHSAAEARRGN